MVQFSIVLIIGLICLTSLDPLWESIELSQFGIMAIIIANTILPAIVAYFFASRFMRDVDRESGKTNIVRKLFSLRQSSLFFETLVLIGYLCDIYLLNFPKMVMKFLMFLLYVPATTSYLIVATLPLTVGVVLVKFAFSEADRRIRSAKRKRSEIFKLQMKMMALPLMPMLFYSVILDLVFFIPGMTIETIEKHMYILNGIFLLLVLLLFTYAPILLSWLWKTTPLPEGKLRARLNSLALRDKIGYKDMMVWHTGSLEIANAAVAGLLARSRKIFLTDVMLEHFSDEEVETVVAHEFGHVRYKHIFTYLVFSLTYFFAYLLFDEFVLRKIELIPVASSVISSISTILFFLLFFVVLFRYLSRRLEHQADLYAVEITGNPLAFKLALLRLAQLNQMPSSIRRIFEFFSTHPSIHRRIELIDETISDRSEIGHYRRYLPEVRLLFILFTFLIYLAILM